MITLTEDQQAIVDFLWEQVKNPDGHNVIVSGSGGTGKTTMVCEMICQLLEEGYTVAVTAMTGKATAVLRNKVWSSIREKKLKFDKKNLLIETVTKLTKKSQVLGLTESGDTLYTNKWKDPRHFNYDVLFVDELSMVPHYISQWWQLSGVRVFGFGDECQLPEVTTADTKRDLANFKHDLKLAEIKYVNGYGVKVLQQMAHMQLHKVLRSDNEVALLCGELRDFKQSKLQMIGKIKSWAEKTENIQYSRSTSDIKTGNDWQILCYTNKMCQDINNKLCINSEYPDLMDKIILFDNLNPLGKYNGDTMLFGELLNTIDKYNMRAKRKIYVCMKWQGKMPKGNTRNPIERNFFQQYVMFKSAIKEANAQRIDGLSDIIYDSGRPSEQVKSWMEEINKIIKNSNDPGDAFISIIEKFQEEDLDMAQHIMENSEPLPQLYMINADFGYAITTHKSQGSEYPKVCYILERFDKPLLYTGLSRAKVQLCIIDLTKT